MHAPATTSCAAVALGPALLTLGVAVGLGIDPRAAAFGSLGAAAIALCTGLAQHRFVVYGLGWALGGQLGGLVLRLGLAMVALGLARGAGIGEAAVTCMALPLAAAVIGDAALLARASALLETTAEDPVRA